MENNINSCLMLACALYTPVNLSSVFDSSDLKDTGVELESHITLLYAMGLRIPRENLLSEIEMILGEEDFNELLSTLENSEWSNSRVFDEFELSSFKNDLDYIVLKLKKESKYYKVFSLINKGLRSKYGVSSDYLYTPHLTLARLVPGKSEKYLGSEKLKLILDHSLISFEDLTISYGPSNVVEDREKYNLTTFNAVSRYFRECRLKEDSKDLLEE